VDDDCVHVGIDDAGRDVQLRVADAVCIDLPETPTTGYRWQIAAFDEGVVALDDDRFELSNSQPGAGGVHHFRFRAVAAGTAAIELHRRRRWENPAQPEYSFRVTAHVSAD
jgi:inhibitor of cysteine peptidase